MSQSIITSEFVLSTGGGGQSDPESEVGLEGLEGGNWLSSSFVIQVEVGNNAEWISRDSCSHSISEEGGLHKGDSMKVVLVVAEVRDTGGKGDGSRLVMAWGYIWSLKAAGIYESLTTICFHSTVRIAVSSI